MPLTLDEALGKRAVKVHETGNVNELQIENLGTDEVFVQSGDIVKGGQQDRVLTVSLMLPPKSGRIPIASFCVEQGRWTARGKEDVKTFATASAVVPSREAKIAMKAPMPVAARRPTPTGGVQRRPMCAPALMRLRDRQPPAARSGPRCARCRRACRRISASRSTPRRRRSSLQLALENEKLKDAQAGYLGGAASPRARRTATWSATSSPSTAS